MRWVSVSNKRTSTTPLPGKTLREIIIQAVCFYVGLNLLRFELHDSTMWKFWIFTQVLITIVPGLVMEKRGTRKGYSLWLHVVLICVALVSFNPWCNMWVCIAPDFFSLQENPWYYIMGVVCLYFAVRPGEIPEASREELRVLRKIIDTETYS